MLQSAVCAFNTGPYTVSPDNSILITANMQSETDFPSSHQLKSYVASKSCLKLAARAVLSADAGFLVLFVRFTSERPIYTTSVNRIPATAVTAACWQSNAENSCKTLMKSWTNSIWFLVNVNRKYLILAWLVFSVEKFEYRVSLVSITGCYENVRR